METQPISMAPFPEVTICPVPGSNTALNSDIRETENITLTKLDKEELIHLANDLAHEPFVEKFLDDNDFWTSHEIRDSLIYTNTSNNE